MNLPTAPAPKAARTSRDLSWWLYMVRCADSSLYTGVCIDIAQRLWQHNHCNKTGARYTRSRRPVQLVYWELCPNKQIAYQREAAIKRSTKTHKEALCHKLTTPRPIV
jgi:putative endonuclease